MTHLTNFDFLQLLATVFLGLVGIAFTVLQARNARRQNTLKLYERWDAHELSRHRSVVWDIWKNLTDADDAAVICWLGGDYLKAKGLPESKWAASSFITTLNRVAALDRVVRRS